MMMPFILKKQNIISHPSAPDKTQQEKDRAKQNLDTPLRKDSFQIWQRSWAVIRVKAWTPGIYQLHCHMEHHIAKGMMLALNILPSQQPPIPQEVPTEGPCPVWSSSITDSNGSTTIVDG